MSRAENADKPTDSQERDERGRFKGSWREQMEQVSKELETSDQSTSKEVTTESGAPAPDASAQDKASTSVTSETTLEPPAHWDADAKATFGGLPRVTQE